MRFFAKASAITTQIETITSLVTITNWDEVATLCEDVNAKEDGAKEAAKALRKKLRLGRPQQQMNSLTLIQAMIDGFQLATAKFAEDIEAVVVSEATDANVKIRLMERLEDWSVTFSTDPGLVVIPQLYHSLVRNNSPRAQQRQAQQQRAPISEEQQLRQMAQDIELARNNAHMLIEAVSFADPDTEAIEENELIKEFHSKCQTLQRGIQGYLSEMTESATPHEQWLTSLLACNQELVQAFTAYDQMMERQHMNKITKVSEMTNVVPDRAREPLFNNNDNNNNNVNNNSNNPFDNDDDLIAFNSNEGAGVGNGKGNGYPSPNGSRVSTGNGKSTSPSHNGAKSPAADPFSDEPFFTTGPADVAAAVKMGKRTDNQDKVFDASAFIRQQQLEQEQLQALRDSQKALHELHNGTGSSQGPTSPIQVSTIP
ncbi:putative actin patch assembly and actin polymerization protein [Entomortierella beljakovae]|nr:putative actin patch assembly and actin polymerization protein [Entomortierella beljakovae]